MAQGYGLKGGCSYVISQIAFFIVMNDYGFPTKQLLFKNGIFILPQNSNDVYDPTLANFGNSKITAGMTCDQYNSQSVLIDWLYSQQASADLRMSALSCQMIGTSAKFTQLFVFS